MQDTEVLDKEPGSLPCCKAKQFLCRDCFVRLPKIPIYNTDKVGVYCPLCRSLLFKAKPTEKELLERKKEIEHQANRDAAFAQQLQEQEGYEEDSDQSFDDFE